MVLECGLSYDALDTLEMPSLVKTTGSRDSVYVPTCADRSRKRCDVCRHRLGACGREPEAQDRSMVA